MEVFKNKLQFANTERDNLKPLSFLKPKNYSIFTWLSLLTISSERETSVFSISNPPVISWFPYFRNIEVWFFSISLEKEKKINRHKTEELFKKAQKTV